MIFSDSPLHLGSGAVVGGGLGPHNIRTCEKICLRKKIFHCNIATLQNGNISRIVKISFKQLEGEYDVGLSFEQD